MKIWTGRILLFFAIFSLGYGLGRQAGSREAATNDRPALPAAAAAPETADDDKVLVYYLHTTFRCATCNAIEQLARQVVEEDFAAEHAAGKVEWHTANFQKREDLAARYGVASSTVVVVNIENGEEKGFKRLDKVWTLHAEPAAFAEYVGGAVREFLEEGK